MLCAGFFLFPRLRSVLHVTTRPHQHPRHPPPRHRHRPLVSHPPTPLDLAGFPANANIPPTPEKSAGASLIHRFSSHAPGWARYRMKVHRAKSVPNLGSWGPNQHRTLVSGFRLYSLRIDCSQHITPTVYPSVEPIACPLELRTHEVLATTQKARATSARQNNDFRSPARHSFT